jgi:hypothetical protein
MFRGIMGVASGIIAADPGIIIGCTCCMEEFRDGGCGGMARGRWARASTGVSSKAARPTSKKKFTRRDTRRDFPGQTMITSNT